MGIRKHRTHPRRTLYPEAGPVTVKNLKGEVLRVEDPIKDRVAHPRTSWTRKFPYPCKYRAWCFRCDKDIFVGQTMAYKPYAAVEHWECYENSKPKAPPDDHLDGTRKYAADHYSNGRNRKRSKADRGRAFKDQKAIARAMARRNSRFDGQAKAEGNSTGV